MNDRFSLLTRLPQSFGFNSRGLKIIGLISSLADLRRSRGEFDQNPMVNHDESYSNRITIESKPR